MDNIATRQLPNGPLILGCSTRSFRTAAIALFVRAGARHETGANGGISHLLEHLLFRGTQSYNAKEIANWVEGQGGSINAFTSEECTCLHMQIYPVNWRKGLDILIDMAANPLLEVHDIDREKAIVGDEARAHADNPTTLLGDLFSKALWGNHPLGNSIEGNARSMDNLTRDQICKYLDQNYSPNRLAITFAGDLNIDEIAQRTQLHCDNWSQKFGGIREDFATSFGKAKDLFKPKKLEQLHFQIGIQLHPLDDQDRCAQSLLSVLFGESMTSRLYREVRENRGLAYHLCSECSHYSDTSSFSIQAISGKDRFLQCLDQVQKQIERLHCDLIDGSELQRAKNYLLGTTFADLDSPMGLSIWLGDQLFNGWSGDFLTPARYEKMINSVNLSQIQQTTDALYGPWRGVFIGPNISDWNLNNWKSWANQTPKSPIN